MTDTNTSGGLPIYPQARINPAAPPHSLTIVEAAAKAPDRRPQPGGVTAVAAALGGDTLVPRPGREAEDAEHVAEVQAVLARIAGLDDAADILHEYTVSTLPYAVARAASRGHSLPTSDNLGRVTDQLDAAALDVTAHRLPGGAIVIGMLAVDAGTAHRALGDYAGWSQQVEWDAQAVQLTYDPRQDRVSAEVQARSVARHTYAAFGGNPVPGTTRNDTKVRPHTDLRSTYAYAAAKAIAAWGQLFGGRVVLARGVTLTVARYPQAGADPRSTHWKVTVTEEVQSR